MDLVDEQRVALAEPGEQRRELALVIDRRARADVQVDAHLVRDHVRERGLAEARRAGEQEVIERPLALLRGVDGDLQVADQIALADVLVEGARAQRRLPRALGAALGRTRSRARLRASGSAGSTCFLRATCLPRHRTQRVPQQALDRRLGRDRADRPPPLRPRSGSSPSRRARTALRRPSGCRSTCPSLDARLRRASTLPASQRSSSSAHFSWSSTTSSSAVFLPTPLIRVRPDDILARDQRRHVARARARQDRDRGRWPDVLHRDQ